MALIPHKRHAAPMQCPVNPAGWLLLLLLAVPPWVPACSGSRLFAAAIEVRAASIPTLQYVDPVAAAELAPQLAAALARQARWLPPAATRPEQTAHVSQQPQAGSTTSLVSALKDPAVTHIVLTGSYDVGSELDGLVIPIDRNLTISGLHGVEDMLDLRFKRAVLHLCSSCTLVFHNITLAGDRRGNGSPIDALVGKPGSKLLLRTGARLRLACASARDTEGVLNNTPRSKLVASPGSKEPQRFLTANVTFKGRTYPHSIVHIDYAVDQPLTVQEGRTPTGGMAQYAVGMLRLCKWEASSECLAAKGPDACLNMLIDEELAKEKGQGSGEAGNKGAIVAAVLVPAVVLALLAAAGAFWLRKRRHRQQLQGAKLAAPGGTPPKDIEAAWSSIICSQPGSEEVASGLGKHSGWQLVSTATAPGGEGADTHVQLQELLGQGSFGRVYRAHWSGREVAVKVIPHSKSTLQEVDNEVSLMLSMHHRNLVRAFQCLTFTQTGSTSAASSRQPSAAAAGSPVATVRVPASTSHRQATSVLLPLGTLQQPRLQPQEQQQPGSTWQQPPVVSDGSPACSGGATDTAEDSLPGSGRRSSAAYQLNAVETWLIMEFCNMGTLWNIFTSAELQQQARGRVAPMLLVLLQDAAQGLQALHSHHICHGDLNARNVLVSSDGTCDCGMVAKLADLGLSRMIKQHATHRTTETVGTMSHCSPELLTNGHMSPAADIYSFGIMMWELWVGQAAFRKMHYAGFYEAIVLRQVRPAVPPEMPADYADLMQWCWAADPKGRPSTDLLCWASCCSSTSSRQQTQHCPCSCTRSWHSELRSLLHHRLLRLLSLRQQLLPSLAKLTQHRQQRLM